MRQDIPQELRTLDLLNFAVRQARPAGCAHAHTRRHAHGRMQAPLRIRLADETRLLPGSHPATPRHDADPQALRHWQQKEQPGLFAVTVPVAHTTSAAPEWACLRQKHSQPEPRRALAGDVHRGVRARRPRAPPPVASAARRAGGCARRGDGAPRGRRRAVLTPPGALMTDPSPFAPLSCLVSNVRGDEPTASLFAPPVPPAPLQVPPIAKPRHERERARATVPDKVVRRLTCAFY